MANTYVCILYSKQEDILYTAAKYYYIYIWHMSY